MLPPNRCLSRDSREINTSLYFAGDVPAIFANRLSSHTFRRFTVASGARDKLNKCFSRYRSSSGFFTPMPLFITCRYTIVVSTLLWLNSSCKVACLPIPEARTAAAIARLTEPSWASCRQRNPFPVGRRLATMCGIVIVSQASVNQIVWGI